MNNHISFPTASSSSLPQNDNSFKEELQRMNLNEEDVQKIRNFLNNINKKNELVSDFWYRYERQNLPECVRTASLRRAIRKKAEEIPSNNEIQDFILNLETSSKLFIDQAEKFIGYDDLADILSKSSKRLQYFLQPAFIFQRSHNDLDEVGRLNTDIIVQYINLKSSLYHYRIVLSYYDEDGTGYLNREQLTSYFHNEIFKSMKKLKNFEDTFLDCYLNTMLSMFFFFLDSKNFGRCRIADILVSGFLESIYAMVNFDENLEDPEALRDNWFSILKTTELIQTFQSLDEDKGYLSPEDFGKILNSGFTTAFTKRFFEVYVSQKGTEMTYSEYVIFEVAQNHLAHPSSIAYFFKIIDVNDDGYITNYELNYFYRDLAEAYNQYIGLENSMPNFGDFSDQLIDMAQPLDPTKITLTDLINCRQGHDFILCLINYLEFYRYENRGEDGGEDDEADTIMEPFVLEPEEEKEVMEKETIKNPNSPKRYSPNDTTFIITENVTMPLKFDETTTTTMEENEEDEDEEVSEEFSLFTGRTFTESSV